MGEKIYGLIGRTLRHSFSVTIHNELGNPYYRLFELEPEELEGFLRDKNIGGVNVTIPYKKSVIPYCRELSPEARAIGSVNTIVPTKSGLLGHNTDAYGFSYLAKRAGITFTGKKVLIFGSGGASLTARYVAERASAKSVAVISRSGENNYDNLHKHDDAEILINTTPVGMYPAEIGSAITDLARFPNCAGVIDLVYNPIRTALIMQAKERQIPHGGGLPMLVAQAKSAEELFAGRKIPDTEIRRILTLISAEKENIVLIGMPGSGKTTIGAALSELTGRELIDLDKKIEEAAKLPIEEIFSRCGEEAFRDLESEQTALYGAMNGIIIVAGGGIVKRERNLPHLRQNGRIYHIIRETGLLERHGRPLSVGADLEQMYIERLPLYTRFRDAAIENLGFPQRAAQEIWGDFCEYTRN